MRVEEIQHAWLQGELSILNRHRDAYAADLVVFVTTLYRDRSDARDGGDVCGAATLPYLVPDTENPGGFREVFDDGSAQPRDFVDQAFAVVEYQCGASEGRNDFTFAHELGHTFGMYHKREDSVPVLPVAYGAVLNTAGGPLATVMACGSTQVPDDEVPLGVCDRIPHFSSPHVTYRIPGCTAEPCQVVTATFDAQGNAREDNARVACERAPTYAAFREPPRNQNEPPSVVIRSVREVSPDGTLRDVGPEVTSGTLVELTAEATDHEDGDLTPRIQWLDHRGAVIGTGRTRRVQLDQSGDFPVSARVTDSGGLVDEWVLPLRVTWGPDAYEVQEPRPESYPLLPFNNHQDRNFHIPGDVDRLQSTVEAQPGETIRVRLVRRGARANPLMQVELFDRSIIGAPAIPLGSETTGELQHTLTANQRGYVRVRIRNTEDAAGVGTDYQVHLERGELPPPPQSVFPKVGPWWNPERSGHGIDFQRTPDGRYALLWYTYRPDGKPTWYISDVAAIEGARWRSPLYASTWDGSANTLAPVGTLEMSFSSDVSAMLSWSFPGTGIQGSETFSFGTFDMGATGVANGTWFPPGESGWGASLWHQGNVGVITAYTYDASGQPTWAQGRAEGAPSAWVFQELNQFTSRGLCPSCSGSSYTVHGDVGTARFWLRDAAAGTGTLTLHLNYDSEVASGSWHRVDVPFVRLTAAP